MFKKTLNFVLAAAMLNSIASFSYAEDAAPVYDADNYPSTFEAPSELSGPPPAAPSSNLAPSQAQDQTSSQADYSSDGESSLGLDQRVAKTEHQINNLQSKDLPGKVEALQTEVQSLRGQVEELTHQLQQAQSQQKAQYSDLDKRIIKQSASSATVAKVKPTLATNEVANTAATTDATNAIDPSDTIPATAKTKNKVKAAPLASSSTATNEASPKPTPKVTVAAKAVDAQPNVAEEQQIYQTAYDFIKAKKYNNAIAALQKMLDKYPSGQFAANAHYWLGELYGLLDKKDQSAVEFSTVANKYPESPKVSDAQLKLGLIYVGQFKWSEAKVTFKNIINHYPGTASARLASEQLKQIKEAGH